MSKCFYNLHTPISFNQSLTDKPMDLTSMMSSVVKRLGARLSRYSGLALRTAAMCAFLSSPSMASLSALNWAAFLVLPTATDVFLPLDLRSCLWCTLLLWATSPGN